MTRDIRHSIFFDASPEATFRALTREDALRRWWTRETRVSDGKTTLNWSGNGWTVELDMTDDPSARTATWVCTQSNMRNTAAWVGTTIQFQLTPDGDGTKLDFSHTGYPDSPCFEAAKTGWTNALGSLKDYLETGKGVPYPENINPSAR